jgi:hypothetical protein
MFVLLCGSDVKDIHETLEVTVYDEDYAGKDEFLGRVLIPLLRVCACNLTAIVLVTS